MIPETPLDLETIRGRLETFIGRSVGSPVHVSNVRQLAGGASRAAYAFDLRTGVEDSPEESPATESVPALDGDEPTRACVLRLDLGGEIYASALSRREEFAVLRAAQAAACEVPRVDWLCEDPGVLARPFFVMDRLEGESIGRRIVKRPDLATARSRLPEQMGRALARIHAIDPVPLDFLARSDFVEVDGRRSAFATALARAREELARIDEPHPALELGLAWLASRAPTVEEHVVVHGDFRLGNLVVDDRGLVGVLDWEFAALSDPHEDLAWPFVRDWRFGNDQLRFAGLSDGEEFLRTYEEVSGRTVDRERLELWEVLGNLRWALGCLTQARRHLRGEEPSVELASLGRRAAEMELEMLDRIVEIVDGRRPALALSSAQSTEGAESPGSSVRSRGSSVHDAPDVDALLESVQSFLLREVSAGADARLRFRSLVATNVLAIARRELASGEDAARSEVVAWQRVMSTSTSTEADRATTDDRLRALRERVAELVRGGSLAAVPDGGVWRVARDALLRKLRVDNPDLLARLEKEARDAR